MCVTGYRVVPFGECVAAGFLTKGGSSAYISRSVTDELV